MEKKYFFKTLLTIVITGLVIVNLWFLFLIKAFPIAKNSYTLGHIDKIEKLKEKSFKNRILFFGGSNVAFGMNSEFLEKNISEYKILNLGTHASLGIRYPLDEINKYLRKGDILILSLEYDHFFSGGYGGVSIWELIAHKRIISGLKLDEFLKIAFSSLDIFKVQLNARVSSKLYGQIFTYDRRGFNEYGDYIEQNKYPIKKNLQYQKWNSNKKIDKNFIQWLKKFVIENKKRGIEVYFIPPALEEKTGINNSKLIKRIENEIKNNDFHYLGKAEEFFFQEKYMYDTIYHLNKEGQQNRSEKILILMENDIDLN